MPRIEPYLTRPFPSRFFSPRSENHVPQRNNYSNAKRSKIGMSQISNVYDVIILRSKTMIEGIIKITVQDKLNVSHFPANSFRKSNFQATNKFRIHRKKT